jgi:hypothetical protein
MLLDHIISTYCGNDNELYNQIAEELSRFMHRKGTDMEMLPGELSDEACACWSMYETEVEKRKQLRQMQESHHLGSLHSIIW